MKEKSFICFGFALPRTKSERKAETPALFVSFWGFRSVFFR